MRDDYLWDGSGTPDPEIQKLEGLLEKYRLTPRPPAFRAIAAATEGLPWWRLQRVVLWVQLAAALMAVLVIAAGYLWLRPKPAVTVEPGWDVTRLAGAPRLGMKTVGANEWASKLRIGQILETDSQSRARIGIDKIGQLDVEPDTRVRVLKSGSELNRVALDRGTIRATIWAPPGQFVVDTASALAVDLGCIYTLHVDDSGAGLLQTTLGWVGFKLGGHESFIPAGAACPTRPKTGPGTPYFEDAPASLRQALSRFDFDAGSSQEREVQLDLVLTHSRRRDALSLWHLLARVEESERSRVYDRLRELVPPPPGVTREGIQKLDPKMLDLWWDQLGLGDISLWRHWERSWSQSQGGAH